MVRRGFRRSEAGAASGVARSAGELEPRLVDSILEAVTNAYDAEYGGFGNAPKFPQTDAILLLLEQSVVRSDPELRKMAVHTLERMSGGGTYDHVEGGFFRYTTTQDWSVPHFEKMLEDHAGLVAGSQDADEHYYSLDASGRTDATPPYIDRRVYTSWNAALAVAYLDAGLPAEKLLDSLFKRAYRKGEGMAHADGVGGQLADQLWSLWAPLRACQHGLGERWLEIARDLASHIEVRFADRELGGYLDHSGDEDLGRLGERIKPLAENSVAAIALIELDILTGDPAAPYRDQARRALESVAALPRQYGLMAAVFARALDRLPHAIKVTTKNRELAIAARSSHPYAVIDPRGAP